MVDEQIKDDEEPSIEDILSSIRDIISDEDDENEDASAEGADDAPVTEEVAEPEDDDVLDLTEVADDTNQKNVPEEGDMASDEKLDTNDIDAMFDTPSDDNDPLAGINLAHPMDDDLDVSDAPKAEEKAEEINIDAMFDTPDEPVAEEPVAEEPEAVAEAPTQPAEAIDESALLNEAASVATVSSMAKLAENIAISRTSAGTTLEDITRDLLRPMLKDWLDENLPTIIERLVATELERLAEKAARK